MADTKIKDADLRFGINDAVFVPAYYAQTHYGDESTANDMENWRIPISTPGASSPGTISLAALQILGQVCIYVGKDIFNPVLQENDPIFFISLKNVIVYSKDDYGNITTWVPAWYTLPEYTKARPIATTLLCYTVNGVMVTIDVNTKAVTKRNILPSMEIASDVEISSNLLSAPSLEFMGMTNHFDVGDTVRKDNGDGTTSFYRLNNVTTDSEGNKSAEWECISDLKLKPKEVTTLSRLPIDKHVIKVTVTQATSMSFALAPMDGMEYIIDILNNTNANIDQPLPNGDDWQVPKESITLVAGKVTEISVRYVFGKYVVKV